MTEYTAEIIKIEFGHLLSAMSAWMPALEGISKTNMEANAATSQVAQSISEWNLPGQFELLTAQLSEAFAVQQETMQALLEWDMLTQMETLNTNIIDNFTLQNESITALAEGMKEYLTEAFAAKDELFQLTMETLTTMLTESFAGSNELLSMLMEGLTAYLVESNAIRNELSQGLVNTLIEKLNEHFTKQDGNFESLRTILLKDVATYFALQRETTVSEFNVLKKEHIDPKMESLSKIGDDIYDKIGEILEILEEIKDWTTSEFFDSVIKELTDDQPTKFEKESLNVAKDANKLAQYGNELATLSNAIAITGLLVAEAGLVLQAMPDILKLTGVGAGIAAAAGILVATALVQHAIKSEPHTTYSYADGGIPGYGELFIAREAGPEFVGSFGSRNVVMNNNQIVDAVSGGVYDAVRRANAEQSQQPIYLNVEAKVRENVLFDMMETVRAERGVRLSTGGAWYKRSIRNMLFHIATEMPKGGVRHEAGQLPWPPLAKSIILFHSLHIT